MVKLEGKAQGKVNDYSFFLISQGMEDIKYTGQVEILKQRKRCTYFTQHIIILWHCMQDTAEAKKNTSSKKRLEKLMEKSPSRAAKHGAGEVTFGLGSP